MSLFGTITVALRTVFIAALGVVALGVVAGLMGIVDARAVALVALCGTAVAFFATVGYFIAADRELKRDLTLANNSLK